MDKSCLVITSISDSDNSVLQTYAKLCNVNNMHFILAGDLKTPSDFHLSGCEYLGTDTQKALPFELGKLLPDNNYAKKNVAYLQAIKQGHSIIIETDDDNLPYPEFWQKRNSEIAGTLVPTSKWVNVYGYFSKKEIWPRGYSLKNIGVKEVITTEKEVRVYSPIQQALADENPDVDAIYRFTRELPVYFEKHRPVILSKNSICPFNSQNTTWFKPAFPLLYLPSTCSFRACDIWRSFIAQKIMWTNNWSLSFSNATVLQKRNVHDLMKDFAEELPDYFGNDRIVKLLSELELKKGEKNIFENLHRCYSLLTEKGFFLKKEMTLVEAWISDLQRLKNQPTLISTFRKS